MDLKQEESVLSLKFKFKYNSWAFVLAWHTLPMTVLLHLAKGSGTTERSIILINDKYHLLDKNIAVAFSGLWIFS